MPPAAGDPRPGDRSPAPGPGHPRRPVLIAAAGQAAIAAGVAMVVGFGVDWSAEQVALVLGFSQAVIALVVAVVVQSRVTPWP